MGAPRQAAWSQLPQTRWPQGSQAAPTELSGGVGQVQLASALLQFCCPGRASMASRKATSFWTAGQQGGKGAGGFVSSGVLGAKQGASPAESRAGFCCALGSGAEPQPAMSSGDTE